MQGARSGGAKKASARVPAKRKVMTRHSKAHRARLGPGAVGVEGLPFSLVAVISAAK